MRDHGSVAEHERRQLRRSRFRAKLLTRSLAQERDRIAVCGDDLLVLDPSVAKRFLHAAARVDFRATVIAVTYEQRWLVSHLQPPAVNRVECSSSKTRRSRKCHRSVESQGVSVIWKWSRDRSSR